MPEIQKPTATIHSPPPRVDSSHNSQEAKVIVHDDPEAPPTPVRGSSPGATPGVPGVAARVAVTGAPRRPQRISVDQATIKISAMDRELALALHHRRHAKPQGMLAASMASVVLMWRWVVRLFGGGGKRR
jgi:hypothetical protein